MYSISGWVLPLQVVSQLLQCCRAKAEGLHGKSGLTAIGSEIDLNAVMSVGKCFIRVMLRSFLNQLGAAWRETLRINHGIPRVRIILVLGFCEPLLMMYDHAAAVFVCSNSEVRSWWPGWVKKIHLWALHRHRRPHQVAFHHGGMTMRKIYGRAS